MIGYVFDKYSFQIENKINNVTSVHDGEIIGDSTVRFGGGSDYVILQSDAINLNIGETISLTGLEDCRNYFLKGKDYWYLEQINKVHIKINEVNVKTDLTGEQLVVNNTLLQQTNGSLEGFTNFFFENNPDLA